MIVFFIREEKRNHKYRRFSRGEAKKILFEKIREYKNVEKQMI
ncbi:hypothetical protein HMPREF9709_01664 [Helcococcus kunzii ATCC 51366]|uniref:Uncharacterized protein n=1 Tax=Helcococcus kunzii ATCC 51366 TaxID=883114 RepID=H3NQQ3_9FIRM|nr:hypothetical protein HMPREF9709_01664 [Helcococcus kunzii ATCC 51366]